MSKKNWIDENLLKSLTKRILLCFILSASLISMSEAEDRTLCNSLTEFSCLDGNCISKTLVCDGIKDCAGGEEEIGCGPVCAERNYTIAKANKYKCRKSCNVGKICKNKKICICDDECGMSCINPGMKCSGEPPTVENTISYEIRRKSDSKNLNRKDEQNYYGDYIKYHCKNGMKLVGPSPRCDGSGKWSEGIPKCVISEVPTGSCYLLLDGDHTLPVCSQEIETNVNKIECCCSRDLRAWGESCEVCPRIGTREHLTLCNVESSTLISIEDSDECTETINPCQGSKCTNLIGSFICECPPGYLLIDNIYNTTCEDIDECIDPQLCLRGECVNAPGSFSCVCPDGYYLNEELLECDNACPGGKCVNLIGSYLYECPVGFSLDIEHLACVDIDEYIFDPQLFLRVCPDGFYLNEKLLQCDKNGQCFTEFTLNGSTPICSNPIQPLLTREQCCCSAYLFAWGSKCKKCPDFGTAEHKALCPDSDGGFKPKPITVLSEDSKECVERPDICNGSICTGGPYTCNCPEGYLFSDEFLDCKDVDECQTEEHGCEFICTNTIGSYQCECPQGMIYNTETTCDDINECLDPGICGTNKICTNNIGSFSCSCDLGFTKVGDECVVVYDY